MDFKSQARLINDFLSKTSLMWSEEVMNGYPQSINNYPKDWLEDLDRLSTRELFEIDSKASFSSIKNSEFLNFLLNIQRLTEVPHLKEFAEVLLEDWAFKGVKFKKRHEIQKIVTKLKEVFDQNPITHVNDIGGGVGHLSRILAHYHSIPSFSIDQSLEFQKIGQERLEKFRKLKNAKEVTFINAIVGVEDQLTAKIFTSDSFSLGLHTCGNLAIKVINQNIDFKTRGLLNFGCCYFKMNVKEDLSVSKFYLENNFINLNLFGLTLATRAHADSNFINFKNRELVKNYRTGFHFLLEEKFNLSGMFDIGESPMSLYQGSFSTYALSKLLDLKINHELDELSLEQFYYKKELQDILKKMFLCNIIRWQIGRVLEVYILLDRAIYLEENGFNVTMEQYFKEALSPRNIGILALLK
jgi:hypothetical protein